MKKKQAQYVHPSIVPVPRKNLDRYRRWVNAAGPIWKEYGALEVHDCVAIDVNKGDMFFDAMRMFWGGFESIARY